MFDQFNASLLIKVIHFFQENLTDLILSLLHMFFNRCKKFLYVIMANFDANLVQFNIK